MAQFKLSLIGQSNLDVANTTIDTAVNKVFDSSYQTVWKDLFHVQPCAGTALNMVAVDGLPQVREFTAALVHSNLRAYTKTVNLRKWEATFDLERELVDKDQSGVIGTRLAAFTSRLATMPDKIAWDMIDANSITGYDGVAALSASHPNVNGTTADNLETGALTWAIMRTVQESMGDLTDENGEPLDINPKTLIVGEELRRLALEQAGPLRPAMIGNSAGQIDTGTGVAVFGFENYDGTNLTVKIWKRMRNSEYLFADTSKSGLKPYCFAEFQKFTLLSQTTEASDAVYERDTYSWSARGWYSPVPMAWQLVHGSVTD